MTSVKVTTNYGGIHNYERIAKIPSYLADIVNGISKLEFNLCPDTSAILSFDIEEKLEYNKVITYKRIIEEYASYSSMVSDTYANISKIKPNCRDKVMRIINAEYRTIKANILKYKVEEDISNIISFNSDDIIKKVLEVLKEKLYDASNLEENVHNEDIEIALEMIVGDAFISCKILENPNKIDSK